MTRPGGQYNFLKRPTSTTLTLRLAERVTTPNISSNATQLFAYANLNTVSASLFGQSAELFDALQMNEGIKQYYSMGVASSLGSAAHLQTALDYVMALHSNTMV